MTGTQGVVQSGLLVGRDAEQSLIADRVAEREAGTAILVRGPAGIGKTALVEEAVRRAGSSRRILRTFGITVGPPPEPFALAMATLDLLADAAAEQPLLVVAEDVQWLDPATVGVLRFIARRLEHDPIVLLATTRDDETDPLQGVAGWVLDLAPLDPDDSGRLLASVVPDLGAANRATILRVAEGNPLALLELPKTVGLTWRGGGGTEWLPLTERLQAAFAARVERLAASARAALTLLALHDSGSLSELLDALSPPGAPEQLQVLEPAVAANLIQVADGTVRFRHGLMRSAVYHLASPRSRAAGHRALARAVGAGTDRGILYRARAATGHDENLAAELALVAERAVGRGAISVAVTTLARAAELTTQAPDKRRYLFLAAGLAYELGQADVGAGGGAARIRALMGLAERSRKLGDDRLAESFLRSAAYGCWMREPGNAVARTMTKAIADAAGTLDAPQRAIMLAYADPVGSGPTVTDIMHDLVTTDLDSVTVYTLGHAASCIGDFELADLFLADAAARLRAEGRLQVLARAVVMQAWARLRRGQWSIAMPLAEEGSRLAEESGQAEWLASGLAGRAMVAALRGDVAEAMRAADRAERIAIPGRMTNVAAVTLLARATAAAADGDFSAAWDYLSRQHRAADPGFSPFQALWSLSHLAYAALQCDRAERTRELIRQLTSRRPPGPRGATLRMNVTYAHALLAPDELIEQRLRRALDLDVGRWPFERSRMQLVLGSRLRRRKQILEARDLLRAAREGFDGLGAGPWAERAREELRAAGVPSRALTRRSGVRCRPRSCRSRGWRPKGFRTARSRSASTCRIGRSPAISTTSSPSSASAAGRS
jgi:tetratricopeptide (TPR) repeat protein